MRGAYGQISFWRSAVDSCPGPCPPSTPPLSWGNLVLVPGFEFPPQKKACHNPGHVLLPQPIIGFGDVAMNMSQSEQYFEAY